MCETISNVGFFSGLLHGAIALWVLIADIFFDLTIYDRCQQSWWYDLGFLAGVMAVIGVAIRVSWFTFLLSFVLWLINLALSMLPISGYVIVGLAVVGLAGLVAVAFLYDFTDIRGERSRRKIKIRR